MSQFFANFSGFTEFRKVCSHLGSNQGLIASYRDTKRLRYRTAPYERLCFISEAFAVNENRTRVTCLEGMHSTTKLRQQWAYALTFYIKNVRGFIVSRARTYDLLLSEILKFLEGRRDSDFAMTTRDYSLSIFINIERELRPAGLAPAWVFPTAS